MEAIPRFGAVVGLVHERHLGQQSGAEIVQIEQPHAESDCIQEQRYKKGMRMEPSFEPRQARRRSYRGCEAHRRASRSSCHAPGL
jgi:hypothetical protein